jgi:sugar phosphate isomerase/epimerase
VSITFINTKKATIVQEGYVEENYGWKLGAQAYTFKNFTFAQTLAKIDTCSLKYVEAFTRQQIGDGIEGTMHFDMDLDTRREVKKMLRKSGIKMLSYGVVKANGIDEWRRVFDFCKDMGIQTITCEPLNEDLDILSSLCDEYEINAAIHNHPKPSTYWNPDSILEAVQGRSERLGACADIGHWVRSGLDPVDALKKLKGHVKHFHFKDLDEKNSKNAHDVIWGKGFSNIAGVMKEMKAQNFKGVISVEYEYNWDNNVPEIQQSVLYFRKQLQ